MKKVFKVFGWIFVAILLVIVALLTYVKLALPAVGDPPEMIIEGTPEQLKRGEYLAHHVMLCMDCHSERDWNTFAGPMVEGSEGRGGEVFNQDLGFPGRYVAPNITPYHLKSWTDGEIFQAITEGVSKDGRALFPIMPHHNYGKLDEKDIKAVIAYIRTLRPIENDTKKSESDFPMNFIINTIPSEANFKTRPSKENKVAYGEYLVTAASCYDCHTKQEKGQFVGKPYAGGMEFKFPDGSVVRSANITPHDTGIGTWSEKMFLMRFKQYADSNYHSAAVKEGQFQTFMPWTMFAGMQDEDIKAIYAYLRTVDPIETSIERFSSANK